jgi:hypothetical protein
VGRALSCGPKRLRFETVKPDMRERILRAAMAEKDSLRRGREARHRKSLRRFSASWKKMKEEAHREEFFLMLKRRI